MIQCSICAETMTASWWRRYFSPRFQLSLVCCHQVVCQPCLYRQVMSVVAEGITGDGRSKLTCPLGCGHDVDDVSIQRCLQRAHASIFSLVRRFLHINLSLEPPMEERRDGRRRVCPKCHAIFCGVCRRPWHVGKTHAGVPCKTYAI